MTTSHSSRHTFRSTITSVFKTLAANDATLVFFLVLSLVTRFAACVPGAAAETDDNEFAEFEFDDEEFEGMPPSAAVPGGEKPRDSGGGAGLGGGGQPADSGGSAAKIPAGEVDDFDDGEGVVEDEEVDEDPDEEEFENFDPSNTRRPGPSGAGSAGGDPKVPPKLVITDVPAHLRNNWLNFQVEVVTLVGLAIYLANYIMGKTKNQSLATAWFNIHKDQLEKNFSVVGDDGREKEKPGQGILMKESDSTFSLWCTGRVACQGMFVQIKLLKRQDLINTISRLVKPQYDQVQIKVTMNADDMDTFVLAIGKKKTLQKYAKEMTDLSQFCTEKKSAENIGLPTSVTILTEIGEATQQMLDPRLADKCFCLRARQPITSQHEVRKGISNSKYICSKTKDICQRAETLVREVVSAIAKFEDAFDYIHISDQFSGPKPQENDQPKTTEVERVMIFNFNIPGKSACSERHVESIQPLLSLVFYCIDKVKRFRLSREFKSKAEKNRVRVASTYLKTTHAARQEAAQQRKEDKIRERKERILSEEDPDRQRRLEKQEAKREAKLTKPRMKQLKVKAM